MGDTLERAKELFTAYYGSYFQMHRAGHYEEYKTYDITKETEADWITEMIAQRTKELSIRDWNAVLELLSIAKNNGDSRILDNVISFTERHLMSSDSIVKLMYAENIIEIIKSVRDKSSIALLHKSYKVTALLLQDIVAKPLIIDPGHELALFNLRDKKALNQRAQNNIDVIKSFLE